MVCDINFTCFHSVEYQNVVISNEQLRFASNCPGRCFFSVQGPDGTDVLFILIRIYDYHISFHNVGA
jgi:hypothetical protein